MKVFLRLISIIAMISLSGCASMFGSHNDFAGPAQPQNVYRLPAGNNDIVGQAYKIKAQAGDTLDSIAQRYDIGGQEIQDANPGKHANRVLSTGTTVTIPAEYILPPPQFRKGIVINVAEMRLYYFDNNNNTLMTFPVAVGREGWSTPLAETYVYRKEEQPTWHVPKIIRDAYFEKTGMEHAKQIDPGPDNPLGDYAIYLHLDGYLIHGTNQPSSIGRSVSSGCIRMYNADVAKLYQYVERGTPVSIIYYPNKAGWQNGKLYLEAHYSLHSAPDEYTPNFATAAEAIQYALQQQAGAVNYQLAQKVTKNHTGIPTQIGAVNVS